MSVTEPSETFAETYIDAADAIGVDADHFGGSTCGVLENQSAGTTFVEPSGSFTYSATSASPSRSKYSKVIDRDTPAVNEIAVVYVGVFTSAGVHWSMTFTDVPTLLTTHA